MTLDEYRRVKPEPVEVTGPSGLRYRIKPITTTTWIKAAGHDEDTAAKIILIDCVVYPPLALKPDPHHVGVDELDPRDAVYLFNRIVEISGITEAQSFRPEPPSGDS